MRFFLAWCRPSFLAVSATVAVATFFLPPLAYAGDASGNPREQKELQKAQQLERQDRYVFAIDSYNKANKLADGKCAECLAHICDLYRKTGDNKRSAKAAAELAKIVTTPQDKATAAILQGAALLREGKEHKKLNLVQQADAEFKKALTFQPHRTQALFLDGQALGISGDDAAARRAFETYIGSADADPILRARAGRYISNPELVREKMAPAFSVQTMQGNTVSLDNLHGKVMLLDFWATWCGPCNEELPHIQKIAQRFQGQPLVVLSVSIDRDQEKWRTFIAKHGMTWPQYWDKGGEMAKTFGVQSIPNYFVIDADGVLRSENMGSGSPIDGRLKKLVARAEKLQGQPAIAAGGQ